VIDLHTLYLDGWMSYQTEQIPLDHPGICYINGEIGAGKSAISEAIYYLLFGKTIRSKDSVNNLINQVLDTGYDISINISVDGIPASIREVRDRKDSGLYFIVSDKDKRAKTDVDTRKAIIDFLGMSADDFKAIAFLGQRQTQLLVEGTPSERAKVLVNLFSLNKYDDIIIETDQKVKEKKREIETLQNLLTSTESEFERLQEELVIDSIEYSAEELEDLNLKLEKGQDKIEKIRNLIEDLVSVLNNADTIKRQHDRAKELHAKLISKKQKISQMGSPAKDIKDMEHDLEDLSKEHTQAAYMLSSSKADMHKADKLDNTCPVTREECPVKIPVKHKDTIVSRCKNQITILTDKIGTLDPNIGKLKGKITQAKEHTRLTHEITVEQASIDSLVLEAVPDIAVENENLEKCRESLNKGREYIIGINKKRDKIIGLRAAAKEQAILRDKINKTLEQKEDAIEQIKLTHATEQDYLQYLSEASRIFKLAKIYKIDLVLELLNKNMNTILKDISSGEYKAEFTTQKKAASGNKTFDKVNIIVHDNFTSLPIELRSGGQITEVGLAVLLSTWKSVAELSNKGVSNLWLDEVFGPLDKNIINLVFDSVVSIAREMGASSVKVISHTDIDTSIFDEIWNVSRINGISRIDINGN